MNKSTKNMELIHKAKKYHDTTCPWGGVAQRIYMMAFDIERLGWEEGDLVAGMIIFADSSLTTGRFVVECDGESNSFENIEVEEKDLVSL